MGKQQSPPTRAGASLGKGKVTPIQVAFLVHRYLADNRYVATLASFQSETTDHFPRARSREAPKGLLGLANILDKYALKEQRITVEQKCRVEALLRGMHDAVQMYCFDDGGVGGCSPPLPSPCRGLIRRWHGPPLQSLSRAWPIGLRAQPG